MSADALDRLESMLAEQLTPTRPAWYVNWQFDTPALESEMDARVAAILAEAGPPTWAAIVTNYRSFFEDFRPHRIVALQLA